MAKELPLKFDANGKLDPNFIEEWGVNQTRTWLESRLRGIDRWVPIDVRLGEDPEALVIGILRDIGAAHPSFQVLSKAILNLLDKANREAPKWPDYMDSLLHICQQIRLPETGPWFTDEIRLLAQDPTAREAHWGGYERVSEIIFGAVVQSPGLPSAASRKAWQSLLSQPRFATLGLLGVSHSFEDQVAHLATWWDAVPISDRQREVNQIIFTALKSEGEDQTISMLRAGATQLPTDLQNAIDQALNDQQARKAFVRRGSHCAAFHRAGFTREALERQTA
ncbi:MAG: hypothetical protein ABR964_13085 [Tepidisphaeraceae bacterium]|jgi:hypothetical protein